MAVHTQCAGSGPSYYWSLQSILRMYQGLIKSNPIITKSITNGIIALIGSSISQAASGREISLKVSRSFLLFGTFVSGPTIHYFYRALEAIFPGKGFGTSLLKVLTDRLVFNPVFLPLTLYVLGRLQGETHQDTTQFIRDNYVATLLVNWKIWTIPQIINFNLVPVEYRVLFGNLVALVWNYYLARTKRSE